MEKYLNVFVKTIFTDRPCGSVAQLAIVPAWYARGAGLESRSGHVLCDIRWPVWGSVLGLQAAKGLSHRYQHGSEQFWGRIYLNREKLSQVECSHSMREVLGSIPGRAKCLFLPCDTYI